MVLGFLNLHLEDRECFPLLSGLSNLKINIFHIKVTLLFVIHFYFISIFLV